MPKKRRRYVLVLFSGGIDSSACIHYFKKLKFEVECAFINYGQSALRTERKAVARLAKHFKIKSKEYRVTTGLVDNNGVIQGRNNLFVAIGFMNFNHPHGAISLGIHAGTKYPDCSVEFVQSVQQIMDIYSSGNVSVDCPFINLRKEEIVHYCKLNRIPLRLTYSCEKGGKKPCGKCDKCLERNAIYESTGIKG